MKISPPHLRITIAVAAVSVVAALAGLEAWRTAPVRQSMRCLSALVGAANRGDLSSARVLCSDRFLSEDGLEAAPHGGVVGLPRSIHRDFRTWRSGDDVLVSPLGEEGIVYRFVRSENGWKYDGAAGFLRGGQLLPPRSAR